MSHYCQCSTAYPDAKMVCQRCGGTDAVAREEVKHKMTDQKYTILLAGYIMGLCSRTGDKPDLIMIDALEKLGCPKQYLDLMRKRKGDEK